MTENKKYDIEFLGEQLDKIIKNKLKENEESEDYHKLREEIHDLEIRLKTIEIAQDGHKQKWSTFLNFIIQLIWVIMAAYILLKLGIQPPL